MLRQSGRHLVRSRFASRTLATGPANRVVSFLKKLFVFRPDESGTTKDFVNAARSQNGGYGAGYRFPAPGSRPPANVPTHASDDSLFDINHYTRDTAKHAMAKESILPVAQLEGGAALNALPDGGAVVDGVQAEEEIKRGSPGNKNPDLLRYDPTGLRSAMSTTNEETDRAIAMHLPQHLSTPWWSKGYSDSAGVDVLAALQGRLEEKGLPPQPGFKASFKVTAGKVDGQW